MKNIIRIAAASLAVGLGTSAVQAASSCNYSLIREAHRIVDLSDELKAEVILHFKHTDEFRHLLSDAAKIRAEAKHIDQLSHNVRSLTDVRHLRADVEDLDELVHHVAELIEDIERCQSRGSHLHGEIRHVKGLVAAMNRTLHNMERMVDDLERRYSRSCEFERRRGQSYNGDRGHDRFRGRSSSYDSRSTGERIAHQVVWEVLRHRRH